MTDKLLTKREAMDRVSVSLSTIDRWIASGSLPIVKMGRNVRIKEADLQAFIDKHTIDGSED